jgi:SagB-type dehydrogenase family enzyme
MSKYIRYVVLILVVLVAGGAAACAGESNPPREDGPVLELEEPRLEGEMSLEATLAERRSIRSFTEETLSLDEVGQLLWAAQGVTDPRGFRTAPSAGALYPLELYVLLPDGVYHYRPAEHRLEQLSAQDLRTAAWEAGLRQDALRDAPAIFLFTAVYARTAEKYGDRAERYVHLEAGHAAQNLLLQVVALDLGAVPIGAMDASHLQNALELPADHEPLYLIPVGHPANAP